MRKKKPYFFLLRKMDKNWNLTNEFRIKRMRANVFCDTLVMVKII